MDAQAILFSTNEWVSWSILYLESITNNPRDLQMVTKVLESAVNNSTKRTQAPSTYFPGVELFPVNDNSPLRESAKDAQLFQMVASHYQFANLGSSLIHSIVQRTKILEIPANTAIPIDHLSLYWILEGHVIATRTSKVQSDHNACLIPGCFFPNKGPIDCDIWIPAYTSETSVTLADLTEDEFLEATSNMGPLRSVFEFYADEREILLNGLENYRKSISMSLRPLSARSQRNGMVSITDSISLIASETISAASYPPGTSFSVQHGVVAIKCNDAIVAYITQDCFKTELARYLNAYPTALIVSVSDISTLMRLQLPEKQKRSKDNADHQLALDSSIEYGIYAAIKKGRDTDVVQQPQEKSLSQDIIRPNLQKLKSFIPLDDRVINYILKNCASQSFSSGELMYSGSLASGASYIIVRGSATVVSESGMTLLKLEAGSNYGDVGDRSKQSNIMSDVIRCHTDAMVLEFKHNTLLDLFKHYPDIEEKMSQAARLSYYRYRRKITFAANDSHRDAIMENVSKMGVFKDLEISDFQKLMLNSSICVYPAGAIVVAAGDTLGDVFVFLHGKANVTSFIDGKSYIHGVRKAGDLMGGNLASNKQKFTVTATSLKVEVLVIDANAFQTFSQVRDEECMYRIKYKLDRNIVDSRLIHLLKHEPIQESLDNVGKDSGIGEGTSIYLPGSPTVKVIVTTPVEPIGYCMPVVDRMCSFLSRKDLLRNRLVCKKWSERILANFTFGQVVLTGSRLSQELMNFWLANKNVESLRCEKSVVLSDPTKKRFPMSHLNDNFVPLEKLPSVGAEWIKNMGQSWPNLHRLYLRQTSIKEILTTSISAHMPQLKSLECPVSTWDEGANSAFLGWKYLEEFDACGKYLKRRASIVPEKILSTSKILKDLTLKTFSVTDTNLRELSSECFYLEHLKMPCSIGINDISLKIIASGFLNLKCLDISSAVDISETGLQALAQGSHNWEKLDFSHITTLTDGCLMKFEIRNFRKLHTLILRNCRLLSMVSLRHIASVAPSLSLLNVTGCPQLSDAQLYFSGDVKVLTNSELADRRLTARCISLQQRYTVVGRNHAAVKPTKKGSAENPLIRRNPRLVL